MIFKFAYVLSYIFIKLNYSDKCENIRLNKFANVVVHHTCNRHEQWRWVLFENCFGLIHHCDTGYTIWYTKVWKRPWSRSKSSSGNSGLQSTTRRKSWRPSSMPCPSHQVNPQNIHTLRPLCTQPQPSGTAQHPHIACLPPPVECWRVPALLQQPKPQQAINPVPWMPTLAQLCELSMGPAGPGFNLPE